MRIFLCGALISASALYANTIFAQEIEELVRDNFNKFIKGFMDVATKLFGS